MKIYPSSAAFAWGDLIMTEYSSGCLRYLLFKQKLNIKTDIPEENQRMGEAGEEKYLEFMLNEQPYPFHRELPFKSEIDGVKVSGRMDFISYHEGFRVIHECKTSKSKPLLYGVIRKGEPKPGHIAQIVCYLVHLNETRAKLIVRYAPTGESRIFKIEINEKGQILIDQKLYKHTVQEQIRHQLLSAKVLKEEIIWDRPCEGACRWCDCADLCLKWDTQEYSTPAQFFEEIKKGERDG